MSRNNAVVEVTGLPEAALDAAAAFHGDWIAKVRRLLRGGDVVVVFEPADHTHHAWRLAAIQELAREAVPHRVNAIEGSGTHDVSETLFFLQSADGVTGQLFAIG